MHLTRRTALKGLAASATIGAAGCAGSNEEPAAETTTQETTQNDSTVRAAFVYHDAIGDFGWQWAHEEGRRQIESEFDWLETEIFEKCDPSVS